MGLKLGWQVASIAILVLTYAGLGLYFNLRLHTDMVYTHMAYLPIILSSLWWGRKGVVVAGILGAITLGFHGLGLSAGAAWSDLSRIGFFFGVALCVGLLRERLMQAERARQLSEEKEQLLLSKSLTGIFVYRDEKILFVNARLAEMLGYRPQDMAGMSIWDLFHEADRPGVHDQVLRRVTEGVSDLHYQCRMVGKDGRILWVDVASSMARYGDETAVLVNVYDITAQREAERKQQELLELARKQEEQLVHSTRLAELGEMAAGVAHELNQPLTGIRNFARNAFYMIDKGVGSPDEVKANLRLISEQVDRAAKIIAQMRELTRRTEREFALVDLNSTIRESVEFLMPQFRLAGVEVSLQLEKDLPLVMADRVRLEQVFLNLMTNARQAMEEMPERRLTVRTFYDAKNPFPITAEVSDTGKGFTQEVAAKLFRPFFSTKKPGQGTGLGLSISMSIIKDHGGTIEGQGVPGKGAKFTVRLPLPKEEKAQEPATYDD